VAIGPHPPPPVASKNPAMRPRGMRSLGRGRSRFPAGNRGRRAKRTSTVIPRIKRKAETPGRARWTGRDDRKSAPQNAPIAPGTPRRHIISRSTLPKRQWATPEIKVVTTSPACTEAETLAGARPIVKSIVVEVTPYPMPSAPSINCAIKPARARISRLTILVFLLPQVSASVLAGQPATDHHMRGRGRRFLVCRCPARRTFGHGEQSTVGGCACVVLG